MQWASVHHDAQNTGNYETPLPVQVGAEDAHVEQRGCCKDKSASAADTALLLGPLGLLALRRRRKGRGERPGEDELSGS